jgi:hypothetical protein
MNISYILLLALFTSIFAQMGNPTLGQGAAFESQTVVSGTDLTFTAPFGGSSNPTYGTSASSPGKEYVPFYYWVFIFFLIISSLRCLVMEV